jgi:hypothetical protein
MKLILPGILLPAILLVSLYSCGQNKNNGNGINTVSKNKTPVALGKIYQLPAEQDGIVPNTNPAMQKSMLNDYIMQMEWHFEMRLTDAERKTYEQIITDMWNSSEKERGNINFWVKNIQDVRAKDWYSIFNELSSRTNSDIMDCGMEGLLSNWTPNSLRGIIKKAAKEGDKEGVFLWNKIISYETPVAEGKIFVSKFTQQYIDAAAEWIAYKINVVANKELIVLNEEKREQMKGMIMAAWNKEETEKKSEYAYGNVQAMLMEASANWNSLRLTKKYSMDSYSTNYNKLNTLADWAKEVVYYCPAVKPFAEARIKEFADYAANMSDTEWKIEFMRLNMQADLSKESFRQMRNSMVESHVLMMNITEPVNSRYRWEVKEVKSY